MPAPLATDPSRARGNAGYVDPTGAAFGPDGRAPQPEGSGGGRPRVAPAAPSPARGARARRLGDVGDRLIAAAALLVAAPLMVLIALLIKLDSRGPVIYRQVRVGLDREPFTLLKFRTLYAERCDPPAAPFKQVTRDDPRVTRVGRLLRRTSLDELPQLINVLTGEMAVVGPRPHAPALATAFAPLVEGYALRHAVKPGITGWAQINGLRGETPTVEAMADRVQLDLEYIRHRSPLLDLKIMLFTLLILFRPSSVY